MNSATVSPLYNAVLVKQLSAIQLLCLHLSLHRYSTTSSSADIEDFVPYIRTLPQDFSTVPLWREVVKDQDWATVLKEEPSVIPPGLLAAMEDVSKRFWKDWTHASFSWVRSALYIYSRAELMSFRYSRVPALLGVKKGR